MASKLPQELNQFLKGLPNVEFSNTVQTSLSQAYIQGVQPFEERFSTTTMNFNATVNQLLPEYTYRRLFNFVPHDTGKLYDSATVTAGNISRAGSVSWSGSRCSYANTVYNTRRNYIANPAPYPQDHWLQPIISSGAIDLKKGLYDFGRQAQNAMTMVKNKEITQGEFNSWMYAVMGPDKRGISRGGTNKRRVY